MPLIFRFFLSFLSFLAISFHADAAFFDFADIFRRFRHAMSST